MFTSLIGLSGLQGLSNPVKHPVAFIRKINLSTPFSYREISSISPTFTETSKNPNQAIPSEALIDYCTCSCHGPKWTTPRAATKVRRYSYS